MIFQFFVAVVLLLVSFSALIIFFFVRTSSLQNVDKERRNQLNHELYDVRLKEVAEDTKQGVVVDQESVVAELQYNLLDDINENEEIKRNNKQWIWVPGIIFLVFSSMATYWSVGAYNEVSNWQVSLQNYPEIQKKLFDQPDVTPSESELKDLMLGLRSHLVNEPNDAQGWVLYSRLGRVFKDKNLALDAIEKALQSAPDNVDIELEYLELKIKLGDEYSQQTAQSMLVNFLKKHPTSYNGWSMYGFIALQQEDFSAAISRWKIMLGLVEVDSERATMLNNSIAYAQKQLLLQQQPAQTQKQVLQQQPAQTQTQKQVTTPAIKGAAYHVNITLAKQVKYEKNSALFVYAQSVDGPAMPIAAIKLPIKNFPIDVVLSDANVMMEGIKLSDHKQFIIKARISSDGSVSQTGGQWFGTSITINSGDTEEVKIEINQQS